MTDGPTALRGLVISDLHLFARRSNGTACLEALQAHRDAVELLVLNGDTFDFRWSTLRDLETTLRAAVDWLQRLLADWPRCQVHVVLGNHDCLAAFEERLRPLAAAQPRLRWHEYWLQLGTALFLHGDCANAAMDAYGLRQAREVWRWDRQRGACAARAYAWADRLGITRLVHAWHFPQRRTVQRVAFYLDRACPAWRRTTRNCYFGHTHEPFAGCVHDGIVFHNTGSAIRGMGFRPMFFEARLGMDATALTG